MEDLLYDGSLIMDDNMQLLFINIDLKSPSAIRLFGGNIAKRAIREPTTGKTLGKLGIKAPLSFRYDARRPYGMILGIYEVSVEHKDGCFNQFTSIRPSEFNSKPSNVL